MDILNKYLIETDKYYLINYLFNKKDLFDRLNIEKNVNVLFISSVDEKINEEYIELSRLLDLKLIISSKVHKDIMIKYNYTNYTMIDYSIFKKDIDPSDNMMPIGFIGKHRDYDEISSLVTDIDFTNTKSKLYFGLFHNDETIFYVQIFNMLNIPVVSSFKFENCINFNYTSTFKSGSKLILNLSNKKLVSDFIHNYFNNNILFHVITPSYNSIKYLPKCIESLRNQLYSNYIHYICDDASTDRTNKYLRSLTDDKIKSISLIENKGAYFARNKLLYMIKPQENKQNYFCILDSDDVFEKYRFIYDVLALTILGEVDGLQSKYSRFTENGVEVIAPRYGMNSISYNYRILKEIGKFWDTRVSGDTEYHRRFLTKYTMNQYDLVTVTMFVRNDGQNLTILHPYPDPEYYSKLRNANKNFKIFNAKNDVRRIFFINVDEAYKIGNEHVYNLNKF